MIHTFSDTIVATGRLPLFMMMVAFALTFLFIRFSTRMIRAEVRWWPGNITTGTVHIHHVVFGLIAMLVSGFGFIAVASYHTPVLNCVFASGFGIGSALVLDEFALVLHLRDVYWSAEGRTSIDAIFVAFAITVMFVLGIHPIGLDGNDFSSSDGDSRWFGITIGIVVLAIQYSLAVVTLLKGKIWTGLLGMFFVPLLIVGSVRLARPDSPWARRRYVHRPSAMERSRHREARYRKPVEQMKVRVQEALAGRFDG
nr:hypothetical protein [Gordonia sp. NB41Y]